MQRGVIWGREVEMQGGPLSYLVYKREFDRDLALDLVETYKSERMATEDFLRYAWTMARTYDDSVSGYEEWLSEFDYREFSIADSPIGVIDSAISAELFRAPKATRAKRLLDRVKRALARWLGALSRRIGA